MTKDEKLEKCINFIKKIDKIDTVAIEELITWSGYCEDCESNDINVDFDGIAKRVIAPKDVDSLKEEAWHLLVDLTD